MTLTFKAGCAAVALTLSLGMAHAAPFDGMSPEAADALLAEAEDCPLVFDLTALGPDRMEILLLAPCHAGESVVLDHAGLILRVPTSENGALFAAIPMLDAEAPVTLTFADGTMAEAMVMPQPVTEIQDVAARW